MVVLLKLIVFDFIFWCDWCVCVVVCDYDWCVDVFCIVGYDLVGVCGGVELCDVEWDVDGVWWKVE